MNIDVYGANIAFDEDPSENLCESEGGRDQAKKKINKKVEAKGKKSEGDL